MPDIFTRILLPVDFSVNTEISVRRAVQLIGNTESAIHLVHVFCPMRLLVKRPAEFHLLFSPRKSPLYKENLKKLGEWKTTLEETLDKTKVTSEIIISQRFCAGQENIGFGKYKQETESEDIPRGNKGWFDGP